MMINDDTIVDISDFFNRYKAELYLVRLGLSMSRM